LGIEAAYEAGRAAHPTLPVPEDRFAAFAEARAATWGGALERAADLYLACACTESVPGAAERFYELFGERIPLFLGKLAQTSDQIDEVRQSVLVRCLLAIGDAPPALATYSGRGSLEGWVRATAVREALALQRDRERHVELTTSVIESPDSDPLIVHYREPVARAFAAATAALPREQRALLRLHYVHGVTTGQLAQMFQVSRATLVRRLAEARDDLFAHLQAALGGVPAEDCEQVLRLVKSQVDLRLSTLLRETAA
jgi:RNA polymerase sigma-70 factor (ECF subfamily)